MQELVGIVRTEPEMLMGLEEVAKLQRRAREVAVQGNREYNSGWHTALDLPNLLTVSEAITRSALERRESRGGHFREESQTPDNEALRDDAIYSYVAAWEYTGTGRQPELHKEPLVFDEVHPSQRSYK